MYPKPGTPVPPSVPTISTMEQRKWHVQLSEGRESDLPQRLEPVGFCRGVSTDKVAPPHFPPSRKPLSNPPSLSPPPQDAGSAVAKAASNTSELKKKVHHQESECGGVMVTYKKRCWSLIAAAAARDGDRHGAVQEPAADGLHDVDERQLHQHLQHHDNGHDHHEHVQVALQHGQRCASCSRRSSLLASLTAALICLAFSILIFSFLLLFLLLVSAAFAPVNDGVIDLTQPKAVYMAGSLVGAAMGVYKCSNMGLLPTTSADWTWLLPIKQAVETSSFVHSFNQ
ncbi:unnamed protein product [Phytophthora fragariaefolia]|uniref:ER membrane protein complex subunit 4 n=1 Tax=Phytophthora fragariaefolia TaxID=1490495 RepID=A0A9W6YIB8_9STRA|nr:unnamed protein product [Phytophthora fragariaefolia]